MKFVCNNCSKEYPIDTFHYRCECGGLFNLSFSKKRGIDFESARYNIDRSLWRFSSSLPELDESIWKEVTMGEGGTPLITLDDNLMGKGEYFMPTLSFKDRGAALLVSLMAQLGVKRCALDSSGNAGTAIAAYCARAHITCEVFVPSSTSDKKIAQIVAHGATVHQIEGSREDTGKAAIEYVEREKLYYASHIYNPFFYEGTKTYVYELFEQYNYSLPDLLILPVGNGTLLLGATIALKELLGGGYITKKPTIVAVQAKNCAPIEYAFTHHLSTVEQIESSPTVAEGIASARPPRKDQLLKAIIQNDGYVVSVDEKQIVAAQQTLAKKGVYVELTSAANYAGYLQYLTQIKGSDSLSAVLPFCGAGLKSLH